MRRGGHALEVESMEKEEESLMRERARSSGRQEYLLFPFLLLFHNTTTVSSNLF